MRAFGAHLKGITSPWNNCKTDSNVAVLLPFIDLLEYWVMPAKEAHNLSSFFWKKKSSCLRTRKWHRSHNTHTHVLLRNTKQLTKFWELSRNSEMSRINKRAEINKYSEKTWCAYFNPLQIFNPVKSNSCGQRKLSSHGNSGCIKLFLQSLTHTGVYWGQLLWLHYFEKVLYLTFIYVL